MTTVYGYLITTADRSLFVRSLEDATWALEDPEYEVKTLIAQEDLQETSSPDFDDYKEVAERLYIINQEQISSTKDMLETAVELIEGIGELSAKKTDNVMEMRGLLALIAQDCKKFLAAED